MGKVTTTTQPNVLAWLFPKGSNHFRGVSRNVFDAIPLARRLTSGENEILHSRVAGHAMAEREIVSMAAHQHRIDFAKKLGHSLVFPRSLVVETMKPFHAAVDVGDETIEANGNPKPYSPHEATPECCSMNNAVANHTREAKAQCFCCRYILVSCCCSEAWKLISA